LSDLKELAGAEGDLIPDPLDANEILTVGRCGSLWLNTW